MKKIFLLVLAGSFFALNSNAQIRKNTNPNQRVLSDSSHHHHQGKMMDELNLTKDQKSQMKSLRESMKHERDAIKNDASLSREQKIEKMKELRKSQSDKMNSILTPEQQAKRNAYIQKMKNNRKMNGRRNSNFSKPDSVSAQ